ncbi:MAG TPA: phosphoglycolate phosphatase [Burkholderiales bacterium]|nr:phosphoglycolate phosphatase [Burkholderiales bacterium]
MIRTVLFDLDGTLADTAPDLAHALNRLLAEQGLPPLPLEYARPWTSSGARGLIKAGLDMDPTDPRYEALRVRFLDLYAEDICVHTRLFPGMEELLRGIEARGLRWGIVTNKAERFTLPLVRAMGLDQRAACVVGGDTTPHAKPHPAPLLHAAGLVGDSPEQCLYVGDDLRDVQSARAAGMPVLAAAFGYLGKDGDPRTWGADGIIQTPLETLNYLG